MLKRNAKLALFLSAAFVAQASATAGELTLYTGAGFQGREITLRDATRDLSSSGFNDRGASMVIRSGRWEVCVHADYRDCQVVEAGEYPNLDRLTNQISSVREIGGSSSGGGWNGADERRDDYRDDYRDNNRNNNRNNGRGEGNRGRGRNQEPSVTMFDSPDLRGRSMPVRGEVPNFAQTGFNDLAQSMVVQSGTWEFCQHRNFGGQCRVFGPGEYRYLDRSFQRQISSARVISNDGGGMGRGRGRERDRDGDGRPDGDARRDGVELFSTAGFNGERSQVRDEVRNMEEMNFNDRAASLIVHSGQWEFCQHADFRGQCLTYGPGRYDRLGSLTGQISSMRRVR